MLEKELTKPLEHSLSSNGVAFGPSSPPAGEFDLLWHIGQLETEEEIKATLSRIVAQMGFDYFLYGGRFVVGHLRHIDCVLTNYPSKWRELYDRQ